MIFKFFKSYPSSSRFTQNSLLCGTRKKKIGRMYRSVFSVHYILALLSFIIALFYRTKLFTDNESVWMIRSDYFDSRIQLTDSSLRMTITVYITSNVTVILENDEEPVSRICESQNTLIDNKIVSVSCLCNNRAIEKTKWAANHDRGLDEKKTCC